MDAIVKKGVRCKTKGPIITLIEKMKGILAGPWLWCYMTHELTMTRGSVDSIMQAFSEKY